MALENVAMRRLLGMVVESEGGSWRATDTGEGERDVRISSSLLPEGRLDWRNVRVMSSSFCLFLVETLA